MRHLLRFFVFFLICRQSMIVQAQLALHVEPEQTTLYGEDTVGSGTKLMWIPSKSAFRAGSVNGNHWDHDSIGSSSVALGLRTKALKSASVALGVGTVASGDFSTALGSGTVASGHASTAMGLRTVASANYCTAVGLYNKNATTAVFDVGVGGNPANRKSALTVHYPSGRVNVGIPGEGNKLLEFNLERTWAFVQHSSEATTALKLQCDPANNNKNFIIDTEGRVGISDDFPSYKLELPNVASNLGGRGRANSWDLYSDARVKRNIAELETPLDDILRLRPVAYDHHTAEFRDGILVVDANEFSQEVGFIAQEVYGVLPELVYQPKDEHSDLWAMNYARMVAVLTGAIQQQQEMIEAQKLEIRDLAKEGKLLKQELAALKDRLKYDVNTHDPSSK